MTSHPQRHQSFDMSDSMFPSCSPNRAPLFRESKRPANTPSDLAEEEVYFGDTESTKPPKKRVRKLPGRSTTSPEIEAPFTNPNAVVFMANMPGEVVGLEEEEPMEAAEPPSMPYGMPSEQQLGIMRVLAEFNHFQTNDRDNGAGDDSTMPDSLQGSNMLYSSGGNMQASSRFHGSGTTAGPSSLNITYTLGAGSAGVSQLEAPPRYTPADASQSTSDAPPPYARGRRPTRD